MTTSHAVRIEADIRETPLLPVLVYSLIFHIFVFFLVPLASRLLWRVEKFERPKTFQLVRMPAPKRAPGPTPVEKPVREKTEPVKAKRVVPRTNRAKPAPASEPEEDLSELEDLLGNLQPVSELSVVSGFPYHWYVNNVQAKVERNWRPATEIPDVHVVVSFTILMNGTISEPKLKHSCGNAALDNLALRAIRVSAPFGKMPIKWGRSLDIDYKLRPMRQ